MSKPKVRIENWQFVSGVLIGNVFDHPRIPDGNWVQTSTIVAMDETRNRCETLNSIYTLGSKKDRT